mgnify:FL=1
MRMQMQPREIVQALVGAGLTQSRIEERTGVSQSTISKLLTGRVDDVRSRLYLRLVDLHAEVCGSESAARGQEARDAA